MRGRPLGEADVPCVGTQGHWEDFRDRIWLGTMYRVNAAFGVFAQYQINPQFRLGVASDFSTAKIRKYNYGTFEVLLSYDFRYNRQGIRSPRYF